MQYWDAQKGKFIESDKLVAWPVLALADSIGFSKEALTNIRDNLGGLEQNQDVVRIVMNKIGGDMINLLDSVGLEKTLSILKIPRMRSLPPGGGKWAVAHGGKWGPPPGNNPPMGPPTPGWHTPPGPIRPGPWADDPGFQDEPIPPMKPGGGVWAPGKEPPPEGEDDDEPIIIPKFDPTEPTGFPDRKPPHERPGGGVWAPGKGPGDEGEDDEGEDDDPDADASQAPITTTHSDNSISIAIPKIGVFIVKPDGSSAFVATAAPEG